MAEIPLYVLAADLTGANGLNETTFASAVTADNPAAATTVLCSQYFQFIANNTRWDLSYRLNFGGTPQFDDPVDPAGVGWHPRIWTHDGTGAAFRPAISTITTGATTLITLATPHGRTAGNTAETLVEGVGGADAAQINRTWVAEFEGTHGLRIELDSTSLTLTNAGTVRLPSWYFFGDAVAGVLGGSTNTDRTFGGGYRALTYQTGGPARFGYEVAFACDAQDYHGPRGEAPYLFQHPGLSPLSARVPKTITAATNASEAVVTAAGHGLPQDPGGEWSVVVYGFTGSWEAANGRVFARYIDDDTFALVGVDSTAFGAIAGTPRVLAAQRMAPVFEELWSDYAARLDEAVQSIVEAGNTVRFDGIVLGAGKIEARDCDFGQARVGDIRVASVTTGFPTRVTFDSPVALSNPASTRMLLQAAFTNAGAELTGRHELIVVDSLNVDVLVETTAAVTAADVRVEVGDAIRWLVDDVQALIDGLQENAAAHSGQSADDVPVTVLLPVYRDAATHTGVSKFQASDAGSAAVLGGLRSLGDRLGNVDVLDVRDIGIGISSNSAPSRDGLFDIGSRAFASVRAMADGILRRDRGVPCYAFIGTSLTVGTQDWLAAIRTNDPNFDGTHDSPRNIRVFDQRTGTNEEWSAVNIVGGIGLPGNGNTNPQYDTNVAVASELSLFNERGRAHHDADVHWFKFGVNGSGITDIWNTRTIVDVSVAGSTVTIQVEADPVGGNYGTGRPIPGSVYPIDVAGMAAAGITGFPDQVINATAVDFRTVTVELAGVGGSYTTGATMGVPGPDWRPAAADLWPILENQVEAWFDRILADGHFPDMRGIVLQIGTNDGLFGEPAEYQDELSSLIDRLRDLLTTRSPGTELDIVLCLERTLAVHPNVTAGQVAQIGQIQTAQQAVAAADARIAIADPNLPAVGTTDRELIRVPIAGDGIHWTFPGYLEFGFIVNNAFETLGLPGTAAAESEGGAAEASASSESASASASTLTSTSAPDLLSKLEEAIDAFLRNGAIQSYTVDGMTVTRANLGELMRYRDQLRSEAFQNQGPTINYARRGEL